MKKVNAFTLLISTLLLFVMSTISLAASPYPDSPNAANLPWHRHDIGELVEAIYIWSEDMDNDGDLDIVATTNKHPGTQPSDIAWFENRLNEGLSWNKVLIRARTDPDTVILTTGVVVADIDQDGHMDVIVGSGDFGLGINGNVHWFKGPADPTQGGAAWEKHSVVTNKTEFVSHVYCRDFDDDGDLDIIGSSAANDFIALNPNDFTDPTATWDSVVIAEDAGVGMWIEDMNGNGNEDVLTTYYEENGNIAFFGIEYENDSFSFTRTNVDPVIDMPFDVAAADFNDDNLMDVAVTVVDKAAGLTGPRKIFWYQAQSDGSYTSHLITDTTKPADLYPGDIDDDGRTDIVTAALFDNKVVWYQNETIGDITSWSELIVDDDINTPGDIELKDIDNDGDLDIVTCSLYGNKVVWYENRINEVHAEKIGIVFIGAGEDEDYGIRWLDGYYDHLFPFWPPGFLAGRPDWEGETCYTHIHFADLAEATICGVAEGTPIDVFCQPHEEYRGYSDPEETLPIVHGMFRHSYVFGDDTFRDTCYDDGISDDPTILFTLLGSETTNPYNTHPWGFDHIGPHVDDPNGVGIGIADFVEMSAFNLMHTHYYTFNALGYQDPYDSQVKEWYYGAGGSTNIKDVLLSSVLNDPDIDPETEVVFRHASEALVENKDIYGQPQVYSESVETAFDELINEESVDRIIVFSLSSGYTNVINYGPFWRDKEGNGISVIPGKTYHECIIDTIDGYGPETVADRDQLIADKPWDMYKTVMKETLDVNNNRVPLSYTLDYGTSTHYDQAILAMLEYTVDKYSIPNDGTSLKIVLTTHGYAGGYLEGAECDVYFRNAPETTNRVINTIMNSFSWNGKFTVVPGPVEFAQPGEGSNYDPPSPGSPFGNIISAGEQVDMAIKGTYINELGEVVDNGIVDDVTNEVYDYVLLIPNTFDGESSDTLGHARKCVLPNHEAATVEGSIDTWVRHEVDQNGLEFGDPAADASYYPFHDSENFTVRVMDGSGWCNEAGNTEIVCKGAAIPDATTIILSGTVLSHPDSTARQEITDAAVEVIVGAIKDPDIGGYDDPPEADQPPEITGGPIRLSDEVPLSEDPANPTPVESDGAAIAWSYNDDYVSCQDIEPRPKTLQWSYRPLEGEDWTTYTVYPDSQGGGTYWIWVWADTTVINESETVEFKVTVTDCANQTVESDTYYIIIDQPPEITGGPIRLSDEVPLSEDPANPTPVESDGAAIAWSYNDDYVSCQDIEPRPKTLQWSYRPLGSEDWTTYTVYPDSQGGGTYWIWVWADTTVINESETVEFKVTVTDCANQTVESDTYYIIIDQPPEITGGPIRLSDEVPLSEDPANPTPVESDGAAIAWSYNDDYVSCQDIEPRPKTLQWSYRPLEGEDWTTYTVYPDSQGGGTYWIWVWADTTVINESETVEFKVTVTDCANQTVESKLYYIDVD